MKEIKKTITSEVIDRIESDDGKFARIIGNFCTEAQARTEVENYERSASTVLFKRLVDRGVLRKINDWGVEKVQCEKEGKELAEDKLRELDVHEICDGIVDNYCDNYDFYIFTPKTEEDLKDLLIYGKMDNEEIWFPKMDNCTGIFSCKENEFVVGEKYLYCEHSEGYKHLYRLDIMRKRLNGWIDWLENN